MQQPQDSNYGIDFFEAQNNVGDTYFLFTIQEGASAGGGVSCYFWYESPEQLLSSIKKRMDFWNWGNGFDVASAALVKIIDAHKNSSSLDSNLLSELSDYSHRNAGVHLWAWGTFEELCSGYEPFSLEARGEFREWCEETEQVSYTSASGDDAQGFSPTEPIIDIERDLFIDYLAQTPT